MKWLIIVDHYGDHKIAEFADEATLEAYLLKEKYYTIAYNSGFTRCGELSHRLNTVTFRDI